MSEILLHFDGGCEPRNPGGVSAAGWIVWLDGEEVDRGHRIVREGGPLSTNNYAEWCALGLGLRSIQGNHHGHDLLIRGDSQLVINQLNRTWACRKEHLRVLRDRCLQILADMDINWRAEWVRRDLNAEADAETAKCYEERGIRVLSRTRTG